MQRLARAVVRELLVGRPHHRPAAQPPDRRLVEHAAGGVGREDVRLHVVDRLGRHGPGPPHAHGVADAPGRDVGNGEPRPRIRELSSQPSSHLAQSLHGDMQAAQGTAEPLGRLLDGREHAQGGQVGGVDARSGRGVGGMTGHAGHDLDVALVQAHVRARVEAAAQALDRPRVRGQERVRLVARGIADDDGLAPAVAHPRHRALVGHGLGQAEGIEEGVVLGGIRAHARAPDGGAERGVVHRDDRAQARARVAQEHDLLVPPALGVGEGLHGAAGFIHRSSQPRTS